MIVNEKLDAKWKALRSKGDSAKIVAFAAKKGHSCTERGINTAFRTGQMSDELFQVIAEFYQQKADMIAAYL